MTVTAGITAAGTTRAATWVPAAVGLPPSVPPLFWLPSQVGSDGGQHVVDGDGDGDSDAEGSSDGLWLGLSLGVGDAGVLLGVGLGLAPSP